MIPAKNKLPLIPLLNLGETPSKFDRHYKTRQAKRWRDAFAILLGLSLLVLVVLALDPLFSQHSLHVGRLIGVVLFCAVFLVVTISFHLRYKSRE